MEYTFPPVQEYCGWSPEPTVIAIVPVWVPVSVGVVSYLIKNEQKNKLFIHFFKKVTKK
jgi:hypothetical protein